MNIDEKTLFDLTEFTDWQKAGLEVMHEGWDGIR
jgi:hypothetical protein